MGNLKRTPLFDVYKHYNGKTIDFGGWELPVQFSSIKEEHEAVRTKAGLFDVSHMGEFELIGSGSLPFLQKMMTNDVEKLENGGAQYTAMCDEKGGTIDDLIIYQLANNHYILVVNAANIEKDFEWLKGHLEKDLVLKNVSNEIAQLAIQGPMAESILQKLSPDFDLKKIGFFKFNKEVNLKGKTALVSRTGYTGEDGFEIYCKPEDTIDLWNDILEAGKTEGILPCGLGARDTLRFEANLLLYGQELSPEISPLEAGIGFAVKLNKEVDFIGKIALKNQKENGLERKIVGIEMMDRGIPRFGYSVFRDGRKIGTITSGTQSPSLKRNIGLALLEITSTKIGTEVEVEVRGKRLKAVVVSTPFYKRANK
ncbi:glycine cleavage system aminomethyltransferase GcvT [Bacillus sp. B15-48]|uniref:glycine cleavage system aminomethyltransferase GcvT n=1 Tax=Bacillus sp. B15-48 TaxID=1548601 RepID=UPI00193F7142|nr:glycine cleavage system aminomethyltransferase GcvT [Bacillus sp. B15-48]MBM4762269.1 glycine cleavage system aminomethyltransferase GcvT [Bacillus sp. B15-48]